MTNKEALKILPDMKGAGDDWDNAIDLAIEALKRKTSDYAISRRVAIDDIETVDPSMILDVEWVKNWVKALPSAQTEERTEERTETHACDCIERQAVIDALDVLCQEHRYRIPGKMETYSQYNEAWQDALDRAEGAIFNLPSVHPEIICCKDCKHWMPYDWMFSEVWKSKNMDDYPEDEIGCAYCDMNMSANDFCSRGERRTDD